MRMRLVLPCLLVAGCARSGGGAVDAGVVHPSSVDADPDIAQVAASGVAASGAAASGAHEPALVVDTGDLDRVRARGRLRVLVFGDDAELMLPRAGASTATDRELAAGLAESLGVEAQPIAVSSYDELVPMLLAGKGDIIAARLAETDERRRLIAFSRPTAVVSELVVGKRGEPAPPKALADLAGKTVTVRKSSSYRESLDALMAGTLPGSGAVAVQVQDAQETKDTAALVADVTAAGGRYTICDSDLFSHVAAFTPDAVALFPLREGRQIAFGVRPTNPELKAAADAYLVQRALTTHARKLFTDDLAAMKKRGSIRMLTRNNAVSYFLHKGNQSGFDYELLRSFAKDNGLRLDVVVPPEADDLVPWLLEGRGDVIAAQLTVTEERARTIAFSQPYLFAEEVLVQRAGEAPLTTLAQLKGKTVTVRKSSSYRATLDALQASAGPFTIVDAPEDLETEQLIAMVASGQIALTVADSTLAAVELAYRSDVQTSLVLGTDRRIAYGVRKNNVALLGALDAFVKQRYRGLEYNVLKKKYFDDARTIVDAHEADARATGALSPYDPLIRQRAKEYGLDWRLMAAQAYQESRFDPNAKSWVGALGLFQVMPATGREMGFVALEDPDTGTHAGVRYMAKLIDQFDEELPFKQRVRFALASYNAGRGHVEDARRLALEQGLDPNKWFGNVEKAMLQLADPKVAKRMRHGYCRGAEPVKYVSEIQSRYDNYVTVVGAHDDDASSP